MRPLDSSCDSIECFWSLSLSVHSQHTFPLAPPASAPVANMSSFERTAAASMNKPKLTTALSKTKTSNSAREKIRKDPKRSPPKSPTHSPPRKKKGSRNPGTNLSTLEKNSLFEMLDKHHPLESDRSQGKNIPSAADLFKSTNLKPDVTLGGDPSRASIT